MKLWFNGKLYNEEEISLDVKTHAFHYGGVFFEGIRAYKNENGGAIFRAQEHYQRLIDSAKIYRIDSLYTVDAFIEASKQLLRENKMDEAYLRPIIYRGAGPLGIMPKGNPVETMIIALDWGRYLGEDGLVKGIRCQTSSWRRNAPGTTPSLAKVSGNYLNSLLIKQEAVENGYDEGIALDVHGYVSEGSGENVFCVKNNILYTPQMSTSALSGITRDSVIQIARAEGITVVEQNIPREFLYTADEVFLTGTAAEITPVREIDHRSIGTGLRGAVTEKIQTRYFKIVTGEDESFAHWLSQY